MYKWIYFWKIKRTPQEYRPTILVTGCSSGIGLALAKLLYKCRDYRVIVTAREKSIGVLRQQFAEDERFIIRALDVADEEDRKHLLQELTSTWGGVDILVNNAGICYRSVLEEMSYEDEKIQLQTNYHGPMSLIKHCLPHMRHRGRGKIINVSSVSGILAMPTMASYSASKSALEAASEALWYEVKPFGINISVIQPGFVRSRSFENTKLSVRSELSMRFDRPYSDLYTNIIPLISRLMRWGLATPESIAGLTLNVIRTQNPPLWVPGAIDSEFFYLLKRFLPRWMTQPFLYSILPKATSWGKKFSKKRHRASLISRWRGL